MRYNTDFELVINMIKSLWQQSIPLSITLSSDDVAHQYPPLPLLINASYYHYFGHYIDTIRTFFHRYLPYPINPGETWLQLSQDKIQISPTDIIYNIYSLYKPQDKVLRLIIHFRKVVEDPVINLLDYYKHQLKSSMCIRNKKQGNVILLSEFTIEQFNNLYENFRKGEYDGFMGDEDVEGERVGFNRLLKKLDYVPLTIFFRQGRVSRQYQPETRLDTIRNLFSDQKSSLYLLGIEVKGNPTLKELIKFCHPDGYLYIVMV